MPCDQTRRVTVNLDVADTQLFKQGLEASGYTVQQIGETMHIYKNGAYFATHADGKFQIRIPNSAGQDVIDREINAMKRAYSRGVVESTCDLYGWNKEEIESNEFEAVKNTF